MAEKTPCIGCVTWVTLLGVLLPLLFGIATIANTLHNQHHIGLNKSIEHNRQTAKEDRKHTHNLFEHIDGKLDGITKTSAYNSAVLAEFKRRENIRNK